ncbi:MAG: hypothetical protein ACPG4T_04135 [Nannocystaceae bacterium]
MTVSEAESPVLPDHEREVGCERAGLTGFNFNFGTSQKVGCDKLGDNRRQRLDTTVNEAGVPVSTWHERLDATASGGLTSFNFGMSQVGAVSRAGFGLRPRMRDARSGGSSQSASESGL